MSEITFIHRKQLYVVPNVYIPNSIKFEMIRDIIFKYNFSEFNDNFHDIYNSLDMEHQHICYWIHFICEEYTRLWIDFDLEFNQIIQSLKWDMVSVFGRTNSKHFHADFVTMICCWRKYKTKYNNWITNDDSHEIIHQLKHLDYHLSLKEKLDRFLSHFDY